MHNLRMDAAELSLLTTLRIAVADRRVTQQEIAHATGVNQSQVSRILAGQCKRSSGNVVALCRFAAERFSSPDLGLSTPVSVRVHALVDALMSGDAEEQEEFVALLSQLLTLRRTWRGRGNA